MRPERQGIKDVPASYDIAITLVDTASGSIVWEHIFSPSVPTTQWYSATPVSIEEVMIIPDSVTGGTFDLRVALADPSWAEDDAYRRFALVNTKLDDGSGRYTVGQVRVLNEPPPTAVPVPTPPTPEAETSSPSTGPGWLSRLVSSFCNWVRSLIARLS
jgi:hypothetical protein